MTTEIQFYHLLSTPLERALPKLMEKALKGGYRMVIMTDSQHKAESLNELLWTYEPSRFLPHGGVDDAQPEEQPIYITYRPENPNNANVLVVTDGSMVEQLEGIVKMLDMFDGRDDAQVQSARKRWKNYKDAGYTLSYIQQQPNGGWQDMTKAA
ncbi:MAG: DNA polymerase III subunit chi [Rickettsiales bacterium]|nr:DNA polymerase III subunit chi [Rickettsiales bacterium]